jgi:prepilin-type N-terminal cleavage/methylation domain-containing protein
MNNKGFTLVELIIVMVIMSVLIGVLAPTYLRYVERTKYTTDCTNIGAILDACEVMAADPDTTWECGDEHKISISIEEDGAEYTGAGPVLMLEKLANPGRFTLKADWGPFEIDAIKDISGHIVFDLSDNDQINQLELYSEALANRLE